jgi:hypothetical protein
MNLWIFGDSFAEMQSPGQTGPEWQLQIVNHFKCDLYNIARKGSSSEWITLQLSKYWKDISKEDIVIVLVPYWDRQCIFIDDPDFNHLPTIENCNKDQKIKDRWSKYSKSQQEAFTKYFMYLHNEELVKLKTKSLYAWINNLKLDIQPLVLETRSELTNNYFVNDNYNTATGNLMDVSLAEWKDINDWYTMTKHSLFSDSRISHLTKQNHIVLANKIIKYIESNTVPDLQTDFHTTFLDKDYVDINV